MPKIRLIFLAILFLFITILTSTITISAQNVVTTIDIIPDADFSVVPNAIGINHKDNKLYVGTINTIFGKNEILVIDNLSGNIIDTIRLPGGFVTHSQIEVNPVTRRIYVANIESNNNDKIHVINGFTNKIITTLEIDDGIGEITVNSATNRIYVVNYKSVTANVIDGQTNKKIDVIRLNKDSDHFFESGGIKVNPFTNRIYVLRNFIGKPQFSAGIREDGLTLEDLLGIPRKDFDPRSEIIDESISADKEIIVIDGTTNRIIETVKLDFDTIAPILNRRVINIVFPPDFPGNPSPVIATNSLEINPLTNTIYINVLIANINPGLFSAVLVMDGLTNKIIDAIDVGGFLGGNDGSAINPGLNRIYLNDLFDNAVKIINGSSNQVILSIDTEIFLSSIKVDPFSNLIYVANFESGQIIVINDEDLDFPPTLTATTDSKAGTFSFRNATVSLLDQNENPLQGIVVRASANRLFATVFPHSMVTNEEGDAIFKFKFNTGFRESNNRKITFTANRLETSITNED